MDKSTFEKLIASDSEISQTEALLLENLQDEFPYCQSAHLLIAKDCQQKKSMLYPKKLRKASTYILDRKVLHHFLSHSIANNVHPENIIIPHQNSVIEEIENTIREIKASREFIINELQPVKKKLENTDSSNFNQSLNKKITSSESRLGEEIIQAEATSSIEQFISYLNHIKHTDESNSVPKQDEVINKFLEADPKITRSIPNTFIEDKVNDLSSKSTELKVELITENYALILLKQNKIEKAIEIYKKLILKYPNKSAYFEAKLNEI